MDFKRAQEIYDAEEKIRVFHNGTPIWIESLNEEKKAATVKPLYGQWGISQVPVTDLDEG